MLPDKYHTGESAKKSWRGEPSGVCWRVCSQREPPHRRPSIELPRRRSKAHSPPPSRKRCTVSSSPQPRERQFLRQLQHQKSPLLKSRILRAHPKNPTFRLDQLGEKEPVEDFDGRRITEEEETRVRISRERESDGGGRILFLSYLFHLFIYLFWGYFMRQRL